MFQRNVIIAVVLLLILGGIGYFALGESESASLQSTTDQSGTSTTATTSVQSQEIVEKLSRLEKINLNQSFLSSPAFRSLSDYSITIKEQPVGRENPFIPALNQTPAKVTDDPLSASFETATGSQSETESAADQPATQQPTNFPDSQSDSNQNQDEQTSPGPPGP